jgi:hypothetical protein
MDYASVELDNLSYPPLARLVMDALQQHPAGISEYELIQWIKQHGYHQFDNIRFWDRLSLFQTHFILFHTLYQLKQLFATNKIGSLEISALKIVVLPARTKTSKDLAEPDPLQGYYLDLKNLHDTTDRDVAKMLENLWKTMGNKDKRSAALAELGLEDPVEFSVIKAQHRKLVMQHHPDRGGSKEKLQAINTAMDILKQLKSTD